MVVYDKLAGIVPLRLQQSNCEFLKLYFGGETEDIPRRWSISLSREYDLHLQKKVKSVEELGSKKAPHGHFSVWTFESNGRCALLVDDTLITSKGSVVEVLVWERLNVLWNTAVLQSQQAANDANADYEQRCVFLKDAIGSIQTSLGLIKAHPYVPNTSVVTNQRFLLAWIGFVETRIQRFNFMHLRQSLGRTPSDRLPSSAVACAVSTSVLLSSIVSLRPLIRKMPLLLLWEESAQASEILYKIFAEYYCSLSDHKFRCERFRVACCLISEFRSLCAKAETSLAQLAGKMEPELQSIIKQAGDHGITALSWIPATAAPCITPCFYIPGIKGESGHYATSICTIDKTKESHPNEDGHHASSVFEPFKKRMKSETVEKAKQSIDQGYAGFDLTETCRHAFIERRWVMVVIWPHNPIDEASCTLRRIIREEGLVYDIIQHNLVCLEGNVANAKSFVVQYGVTHFPFVALVHSMTKELQWSHSHWSANGFAADMIAEACMEFCSHDAFEGLSEEKRDNRLPGCDPPTNLVYTAGGFRAALTEAASVERWMLVNLQSDDSLASHLLNRDVWHDENAESLVRENFVFWQKFDVSEEGRVFVKVFNVKKFPHVCILDPYTGRVVWRWEAEQPLSALMFAEAVMELPSLDERKAAASRQTSVVGSQDDESTWDLCSLYESWEKLSMGTTDDGRQDLAALSIVPSTSTAIPTEIFTKTIEEE